MNTTTERVIRMQTTERVIRMQSGSNHELRRKGG